MKKNTIIGLQLVVIIALLSIVLWPSGDNIVTEHNQNDQELADKIKKKDSVLRVLVRKNIRIQTEKDSIIKLKDKTQRYIEYLLNTQHEKVIADIDDNTICQDISYFASHTGYITPAKED